MNGVSAAGAVGAGAVGASLFGALARALFCGAWGSIRAWGGAAGALVGVAAAEDFSGVAGVGGSMAVVVFAGADDRFSSAGVDAVASGWSAAAIAGGCSFGA